MTRPTLILLACAPLGLASAHAQTEDQALVRCAQIGDAELRLACFDRLAADARQRIAAAASGVPDARMVAEFGRPARPDGSELEVIESSIRGSFEGWRAGQRIELANGQVWQITDDSSSFADLKDPVVRVRRAAMGSFMMEIEGIRRSPRVRRVK